MTLPFDPETIAQFARDGDPFAPVGPEGVVPLGHDRGIFYLLSRTTRQVHGLKPQEFSRNTLMMLASVPHYWQRSVFVTNKGTIDWEAATDHLMRACRDVGIYDPNRVRGRGAWLDAGRAVLHTGDRLIVDGEPSDLLLANSRYVYEAALPLNTAHAKPLTTEEARKLVSICRSLAWQQPLHGMLYAGFIAVAPVCGALAWRPSIWVTGSSGSGKSWIKDNILAPALAGMALMVQSKTTEAGIRQSLNSDARPVVFDEAEREDAQAGIRMQGVLDLLRQSSSEGGSEIVKGTQNQSGAKRYHIRSCFALSSINVGIEHQADESRITVMPLMDYNPAGTAAFAALNALVLTTLTPAFAAGLLSRSVRLLPTLRANALVFARAVALKLGSRRAGDQIGTLLAGAWSLHSDLAVTASQADAWINSHEWDGSASGMVERDELRLLSHLTQWRLSINRGAGPPLILTMGRLMVAATGNDGQIIHDEAKRELRQIGIKHAVRDGAEGFWVSNTHPYLRKVMAGTPWSAGHALALARVPNAVGGERLTHWFTGGHVARAVWLPADTVLGTPDQQEEEGSLLAVLERDRGR